MNNKLKVSAVVFFVVMAIFSMLGISFHVKQRHFDWSMSTLFEGCSSTGCLNRELRLKKNYDKVEMEDILFSLGFKETGGATVYSEEGSVEGEIIRYMSIDYLLEVYVPSDSDESVTSRITNQDLSNIPLIIR